MPRHVIALAESDSYLKWAVSLLAGLAQHDQVTVAVACSPVRPSSEQTAAALSGTAFSGRSLPVLSPHALQQRVQRERPDAVLLACTGPTLHAYCAALAQAQQRTGHRPVLVAGIPGIALPARRRAWMFRGAIDLMVVHSQHEVAEYERARDLTARHGEVALARLPFLDPGAFARPGELPVAAPVRGNRVLFATQGKVPQVREQRVRILVALRDLALARPDLDVVVKTRGRPGEFHTHYERYHYELLWQQLIATGEVPASHAGLLSFVAGSMAEQLAHAAALVTVSSTAVLEAIALQVPVLLIDDFGVDEGMINQVFVGSGVQRDLAALVAGDFRHPQRWWLRRNYFHADVDNTWLARLDALVAAARAGSLAPIADGLDPARDARRRRLDHLRLTPAGSAASRWRQRVRQRLAPAEQAAG